MAYNAKLGTQTFKESTVIDYTHPPVVWDFPVATGQGELAPGTVVALNAAGAVVPYAKDSVNLGTGDGTTTSFTGSFGGPVEPGTVVVTDGTQILRDDGFGNLYGDGSGQVNYQTGDVNASFQNAPGSGVAVTASAGRKLLGILTMRVDTNNEDVAPVLIHGCAVRKYVTVGGNLVDDETVALLRAKQIFVR